MDVINYNNDYFVNLKEVCDLLGVDYDEALKRSVYILRNKIGENIEYIYINDECWISYVGLFLLFKNVKGYRDIRNELVEKIKSEKK